MVEWDTEGENGTRTASSLEETVGPMSSKWLALRASGDQEAAQARLEGSNNISGSSVISQCANPPKQASSMAARWDSGNAIMPWRSDLARSDT